MFIKNSVKIVVAFAVSILPQVCYLRGANPIELVFILDESATTMLSQARFLQIKPTPL